MKTSFHQTVKLKFLWWKNTWWFQWAHKPLCDKFHKETFQFGRLHLCRSCTLLYTALMGALLLLCSVSLPADSFAFVAACLGLVLAASHPKVYQIWSRGFRDLWRAGFGFLLPLTLYTAWKVNWLLPVLSAGLLWIVWSWFSRVRSEVKSHKCENCPELNEEGVCSGYQRQSMAIRKYEEAATELVYQLQLPPRQ